MIAGIGRGLLRTRVQRVWSHMSMSRKGLSTRDGRSAHRTHEHGGTACGKAKDLALAWKRMWTWIWTGMNPPKDGGARCDVSHVSAARRERLYSAVEHRIGITYAYASSRRVPVHVYAARGARAHGCEQRCRRCRSLPSLSLMAWLRRSPRLEQCRLGCLVLGRARVSRNSFRNLLCCAFFRCAKFRAKFDMLCISPKPKLSRNSPPWRGKDSTEP